MENSACLMRVPIFLCMCEICYEPFRLPFLQLALLRDKICTVRCQLRKLTAYQLYVVSTYYFEWVYAFSKSKYECYKFFEGGGEKSRSVYFASDMSTNSSHSPFHQPILLLQSITKILNYGNTDDEDEASYAIIPQNVVNKVSIQLTTEI